MEEQVKIETLPGPEDTQPIQTNSRFRSRRLRWILFSFSSIVFASLIILLVLPTLFTPPSELASPYEVFSLARVSEELDSTRDHLVMALDDVVALYIPEGVELGEGNLVILPRQDEFVPDRIDSESFREHAIDIFLVRPNGDLVNSIAFQPAILLCFQLDLQDVRDRELGVAQYDVQRYEEGGPEVGWVTLEPAPGWSEDQICSALEHLSLYAMSIQPGPEATDTVIPKSIETTETPLATQELEGGALDLYGLPLGPLGP
jgi:hypothetical protein